MAVRVEGATERSSIGDVGVKIPLVERSQAEQIPNLPLGRPEG